MCKRILSLVLALALMLGMAALADAPEKALKLYSFTNDEGVLELGISYDDKLLFSTPCEGTAPWLMLDKIDGEMILFIYTNKLSRVTLVDMAQEGASTKHFPPIELDGVWSDVCIAQNAGEITLNVLKDCIIEKLTLLETVSLNQLGYISEIFTPESGEEAYTDAVLAFADKLSEALIAAEDDPELDDTIVINAKAKKSNAPKLPACGNKNHKIDDGWDHSKAECGIPGHFNCDEYEHVCCEGCGEWECESFDAHYECNVCGEYLCKDDHNAEECMAKITCGIEDHSIYDMLDHGVCEHCTEHLCNGECHDYCDTCGSYICTSNVGICEYCGSHACTGEHGAAPCGVDLTHAICDGDCHEFCDLCGYYICQSDIGLCVNCGLHACGSDHEPAECGTDGHTICDGETHAICEGCNKPLCSEGEHVQAECGHYKCAEAVFIPENHAECPGCGMRPCAEGYEGKIHELAPCKLHYQCMTGYNELEHAGITTCIGCGKVSCSEGEHGQADCQVSDHYKCDGRTHSKCPGCDMLLCDTNYDPANHAEAACGTQGHYKCDDGSHGFHFCNIHRLCNGDEEDDHKPADCGYKGHYDCTGRPHGTEEMACGHYTCARADGDHSEAACGTEGHYNCDGKTHSATPMACGHLPCADGDHSEAGCKVTGHFNCDGNMHLCPDCDVAICQDSDHGH